MNKLRKNCFLLVSVMIISMFLLTSVTYAAEVDLESLDVQVKPEYDKEKSIFLMMAGELKEKDAKAEVVFYMPEKIIQDSSLHYCAIDEEGQHQCQYPERTKEGKLYRVPTPIAQKKFQVEGYSEGITDNNGQKALSYTFKAGQDINDLRISLAHPKNATDYKTKPEAQSTSNDDSGLKNHIYAFKNVKKNKEYNFEISYKKKGWDVSLERAGMGAAASQTSGGSKSGSSVDAMTIIIALIIAVTFVAIIFIVFSRKGQESNRPRKGTVPPKGKGRFCTNCGTRMQGGAKFCPNCGSKSK